MKIHRRFPIQDFADVPFDKQTAKVKYKFPTEGQLRKMALDQTQAEFSMSICKYCVEEIANLTDQEDKPVQMELVENGTGKELSEFSVALLVTNQLHIPIASFYLEKLNPTPTVKKK